MAGQSKLLQVGRFFSEEHKTLVAFVRGLINDAADRDAEDIVQDVAFHLFDNGDITEPIENLAAYVYTALRNRVIDSFRRRKRSESLDKPLFDDDEGLCLRDVLRDLENDPELCIEHKDLFGRSMEIINGLPERERALIIATEVEGFSFAELAQLWSVPIGTLLARKSRSIAKIRKTLQRLLNNI